MAYVNPLGQIRGIVNQRVDQGVDFTGAGSILALGNGTVIETGGGGWPGGPFMSYRLNDGPAAGKVVYVAEEITPTVRAGQNITAGQPIANLHGFTEMGWADQSGVRPMSQTAAAGGISGANLPQGGTLIGRNFEALLRSLGAGAANNLGGRTGGSLPAGFPDWGTTSTSGGGGGTTVNVVGEPAPLHANLTGFFPGPLPELLAGPQGIIEGVARLLGGNVASAPEGLWHALAAIATDLTEITRNLEWLFQPSHWVRIGAFILGTGALIPGINDLRKAGSGDASLAMGILLVTLAGVLYFIAFHNLPADVKDLRGLLGYISEGIRGKAAPAELAEAKK